ncbi:MAG TPA: hypothetical protein VFS70_02875 [Actinomycetota bacterium]|nr:hypothetical protein [Actinomycetota bacterium]
MDTIWQLVVGFLLTTVLGGLLGTYLQERSWRHQNEARLQEAELRRAEAVCQAVSGLLDKRRYRMLRLFHALRGRGQETVSADGLAARLGDYDRVLYEWNDTLNVNLAMVAASFGRFAWRELERIYETYRAVGGELEDAYRQAAAGSRPTNLAGLGSRLEELDEIAYSFNLVMMAQLRNGTVGRHAPDPLEVTAGSSAGGSM